MYGAEVFYGNEIKARPDAEAVSNPRVWMDYNITLGWGMLREFSLYTIPWEGVPDSPVYIRLQIWKPYTREDFQFGLLRWEKRLQITQFATKLEVFINATLICAPLQVIQTKHRNTDTRTHTRTHIHTPAL